MKHLRLGRFRFTLWYPTRWWDLLRVFEVDIGAGPWAGGACFVVFGFGVELDFIIRRRPWPKLS